MITDPPTLSPLYMQTQACSSKHTGTYLLVAHKPSGVGVVVCQRGRRRLERQQSLHERSHSREVEHTTHSGGRHVTLKQHQPGGTNGRPDDGILEIIILKNNNENNNDNFAARY